MTRSTPTRHAGFVERLLAGCLLAASVLAGPAAAADPEDEPKEMTPEERQEFRPTRPEDLPPAPRQFRRGQTYREIAGGEPEPATTNQAQPAAGAPDEILPNPVLDENCTITFSETAEPMELTALVDLVANTLGINISVRGELKGSVLFNAARTVPCDRLLALLDAMLEQHDFSITYDAESGFYLIQPKANIPVVFGDQLASTRLIEIPTITPSSLADPISQILGTGGATGTASGVSFIDELGLIVITNTPRQIARVEELIAQVLSRLGSMTLTPIELRYISAPAARDRLVSLVGGSTSSDLGGLAGQAARAVRRGGDQGQPQSIGPASGGSLENLAQRLSVDPQSNALLFRGTPDELDRVISYVAMIDVENTLKAKRHFVGTAARQLAEFAKQRGLGEVIILDDTDQQSQFGGNRAITQQTQGNPLFQTDQESVAGPTLVVDVRNGEIVYYGTEDQQEVLAEMIATLDTEADRVVIRQYKLHHAVAEEVAEVITALLTGDTGVGQNTLLPQSQGARSQTPQVQRSFEGGADGEIGTFDPSQVFVVPDTPNNQIIVKAPVKQQEDFAELIERLDLRRRQVYIEALIVSVSDTENFRFAVDSQFQIGQFRGQTDFGLTEPGTDFIASRSPLTGLGGLTAALIKTEYLPIVITAIENETDGRILSRPQLLVNDNEEASIVSVEEQPTATTSQGDGGTVTSVGEPVTAGTTLTVTPGISEAGFLRLEYAITFDNFIGTGTDTLPPPANRREVNGSVTMPTDTTIVVGGLTVDNAGSTVIKVPLLGDIPLIGSLFSDTNKTSSTSLLYIFITPKILVDPDFRDLRLLTKGPQFEAEIDPDLPELEPVAIDRLDRGVNQD